MLRVGESTAPVCERLEAQSGRTDADDLRGSRSSSSDRGQDSRGAAELIAEILCWDVREGEDDKKKTADGKQEKQVRLSPLTKGRSILKSRRRCNP
jgi:hypothetical protein